MEGVEGVEEVDAHAVILAGGSGTRFWPASTPDRPKQFLPLASERPLLVDTARRAETLVGRDRILVVAAAALAEPTRRLLPELSEDRFLFEPAPRGTGPALTWAAHAIAARDPRGVIVSLHADHRIEPIGELRETLSRAVRAAREGWLCCLGVRPDRPETGYGYVRLGREIAEGVHAVQRFVEKPDRETARAYVASGDHLWNSGIFVWRADAFLGAVRSHAPEIAAALPRLEAGDPRGFFARVAPISVDVGVMERADRIATVEASFTWDDVGVWDALPRTRGSDAAGNAAVGPARFHEADDNVVWVEDVRASLIGVSGLVVVEANGELLVTTRSLAPRLKELRTALEEGGTGDAPAEEAGRPGGPPEGTQEPPDG